MSSCTKGEGESWRLLQNARRWLDFKLRARYNKCIFLPDFNKKEHFKVKRFFGSVAALVMLCVLFAVTVTAALADVSDYTPPSLKASSAVNYLSEDFEKYNAGSAYGTSPINMVRFSSAMKTVTQHTVTGSSVTNNYLRLESAPDTNNPFINGTARVNQRSVYMQLQPHKSYTSPTYLSGAYDPDLSDGFDASVSVNFDYMTFDFDIAAAGARIEYVSGSYGRASDYSENADGSVTALLTDGSTVHTSKNGRVTTVTAADGTVTLWETLPEGVRRTVTSADGKRTVSLTSVGTDGSAERTVTEYGADGTELSSLKILRSPVTASGSYTLTHEDGTTVAYARSSTSAGSHESFTVTSGESVTVYSRLVKVSDTEELRADSVTVNGVKVGENVSTFPKSSGNVTHTKGYMDFDSEWNALPSLTDDDAYGKHIKDVRVVYAPINWYNTVRYARLNEKTEGDKVTYSYSWTAKQNFYYLSYSGGSWGIFAGSGNSGLEEHRIATLPSEIGVWTHISVVYASDPQNYKASTAYFFVDGEYLHSHEFAMPSGYSFASVEDFRINVSAASALLPSGDEHYWAFAIDNAATNIYVPTYDGGERVAYSSGEAYGVDDLIADVRSGREGFLFDCEDTVFGSSYRYPHGERYVSIDSGDRIYVPALAERAIGNIKNGAVIETAFDICVRVPEDVTEATVITPNNSAVTLDGETAMRLKLVYTGEENGVHTYLIKALEASDVITLEWVDPDGNALREETLVPGQLADAAGLNASLYDIETMTATVVTGWYWDLDGEGDEYSEEEISSYTVADALKIGGKRVTVYPGCETVQLSEGIDYVAYYTDKGVTRLADTNVERLSDVNNLSQSIAVFPSGTQLRFVSEDDVIYLKPNTSYSIEGISLKIDLNGKTLARVMSAAYSTGVFRLGEGGSIEITSSLLGARVFLANNRSKNTDTVMFGTDGLVEIKAGVDSARVRLSDFEFNGGTMVKANGNHAEDSMPEYANDIPITVDVERVRVNAPLRSSYAGFATLTPDVVINIVDSEFYVPNGTYAVFHDYANVPSEKKYYQSETHASMKGCKIISVTEAEVPKMAKVWFAMGAYSTFFAEDCEIIGKLADSKGAIDGKITFGAGVVIASDKLDYFEGSGIGYAEGVTNMLNTEGLDRDLTLSFTRSGLVGDFSLYDADRITIADSCFTDTVTVTRSYPISFVSFTEDELPDFLGSVEWLDDKGVHIVDRYYSFVGLPLEVPMTLKELGCYDSVTEWYTRTYSWANYDGTPVPETVAHGVSSYAPLLTETVHVNNKKASMTLGAGEVFNLYLPMPDVNVKSDSVYSVDAIGRSAVEVTVGGFRMLRLSFATDTVELENKTVTVSFTPRTGKELFFEVEIGALAYAEALVNNCDCGSEESRLARELVNYKRALAGYFGVTQDENDEAALAAFEAALSTHGNGCSCGAGFESLTAEQRPLSVYTDAGIESISYAVSEGKASLKIGVTGGASVKSVTYLAQGGKTVTHDAASGTLKRAEFDTGAVYSVDGIALGEAFAEVRITVSLGSADTVIEYSLAQYVATATGGSGSNSSVRDAIVSFAAAIA